ncbi:hypothetical protein K4G60_g336 [Candida parapsilosis]|nr:hypothetical protein K4G60_g336 [Candida parapsilosis]KAI5907439.1 hypothetical protein K4G61_g1100 [Candida parapsilosis]
MHIWYFTIYMMMVTTYVSFSTISVSFAFRLPRRKQQRELEIAKQEEDKSLLQHPHPYHAQPPIISTYSILKDSTIEKSRKDYLEDDASSLHLFSISSLSHLSPRYLINPNYIYKLNNNTGVIIHSSKLFPTTSTTTSFSSHQNKWIFMSTPYPPTQTQVHFPISKCLNQQFGDGGSIDVQSTVFASFINTLDLSLGLNILFASESFTIRFELTKSITWRNLYTCTVPDGMIGQMWARSNVVDFDVVDLSFIEFEREDPNINATNEASVLNKRFSFRNKLRGFKKTGSRRSKLHTKKDKIKLIFWRKLQKIKMFNGGGGGSGGSQRRPIISCVTDVRLLDCSGKRTRDEQKLESI